jgi:curved DNA-binding protein
MNYEDYYKTLGVPRNASQEDIKKAFRELARKNHPDANKDDPTAEERFKKINEAYQVLSNEDKRNKYDRFGKDWERYSQMGGNPQDFNWGNYTNIDPNDLFGRGGFGGSAGGFSDFFEALFGRGGMSGMGGFGGMQATPRAVEHPLTITLEEAYHGTSRIMQRSDGSQAEVRIPKGVKTGSKVRLAGGAGGGQDLYLKITVQDHPLFAREKTTLKVSVPVDLYTAVLGGKVQVPTLDRPLMLTVPAGTANGKTFRLRGKGMPKLRTPKEHGDLYATLDIQLPENLTDEEKQLFAQLRDLRTS